MNWNELSDAKQLEELTTQSHQQPVLIFKHSSSCSISKTALGRLERNWNEGEMKKVKPYFLDLLSYRTISNEIVNQFFVEHESPQILIIRNGKSVYDRSHFDIDYKSVRSEIEK
ncbi:MAG: bacillithiol system redox-active protein YtxJ [Bacteroidia bacterium]|nr:bacillithiol system redox-active protein YtxJ [Bacteroidia bacterium]